MKIREKIIPKIRFAIFGLLLILWIFVVIDIVAEQRYIPISGFIVLFSFPALFYLIATFLLILRKRWADFVSLLFFTINLYRIVSGSIAYCQEQKLNTVTLCTKSVFMILSDRQWIDIFFNILSVVTILFLLTILLIDTFKKKDLELK
ncbi:MAG TPA: hypothetical protein VGC76_07780 [Pyrinomonadaceae bacterium]|jgi:hypothetical protein